jgi:hypothetical protein
MRSKLFGAILVTLSVASLALGQRVIFADDMSVFPGAWTLGGTVGQYWTQKANRWYSSSYSAKCSPDDNLYANSVDVTMTRTISLSGYASGTVSFWVWQETEGPDWVYLDYSTDGGTSWTTVWSRAGTGYASWQQITAGIPGSANRVRFRFYTDGSVVYRGVYVDDVVLYGVNLGSMIWSDDMTNFPTDWNCYYTNSTYPYNWGQSSRKSHSPSYSAQCAGLDSGYYDYQDNYMARPVNLGGSPGVLSYWAWWYIESGFDYFRPDYHTPGSWYTGLPSQTYTGGWTQFSYALPSNCDSIRFYFHSDVSITYTGVYIDDVSVNYQSPPADVAATAIISPTAFTDSGSTVPVTATVQNNSTVAVGTPVYFQVGNGSQYRAMTAVDNVPPSGGTATAVFPNWTVSVPTGSYALKCSTAYLSDNNQGNNVVTGSTTVLFHDVGTIALLVPAGTIDSGNPVAPACSVQNFGNSPESYSVRMKIGATYDQTVSIPSHPPASKLYVTFPIWSQPERGNLVVTCSTELAYDSQRDNDRRPGSVLVHVHDIGVISIDTPATVQPVGFFVARAWFKNYGNVGENSVPVYFTFDASQQTRIVGYMSPGAQVQVSWPAGFIMTEGTHTAFAECDLGFDLVPVNDTLRKIVHSPATPTHDVGAVTVVAPSGVVDSGATVTPQAQVRNYGSDAETFGIRLKIGASYSDVITRTVAGLADSVFSFALWTALQRGTNAITCSTELSSDNNRGNDRATGTVAVAVHDAGAVAIVAPAPLVPPGLLTPRARERNYGTAREPVDVTFMISGTPPYSSTISLTSGLPFVDTVLSFAPDWDAQPGGYTATCSLYQANDQQAANNVLSQPFTVGAIDVGVLRILGPLGAYDTSLAITPTARVKNYADVTTSFMAYFLIDNGSDANVYTDSAPVADLAAGDSAPVSFVDWAKPHAVGSYTTRCSTYAAGDRNHGNDAQGGSFTITAPVPPPADTGWTQKADFPAGPKGKKVKDGACLAYEEGATDADSSYIYALKGNNRCEFYQYNTSANTWVAKESLPPIGSSGKKKMVKKGASLAAAGGSLYATKGNNTVEFWEYRPLTDDYPWVQKADVPTGAKNVKEGTGAVSITSGETTYVYLLKGSGTQEFYRYNTLSNTWQTMATAPAGLSGKPYKNGSCLAYDGSNVIYALKGSYDEFFAYHVDSNSWTTRTPLPLVGASGKKKKVKDGAGLAFHDGNVYAVKGGNTQEFWSYAADSDKWLQYPDVPLGAGKKVKGGGALVYARIPNALYATKGNNTLEFYRYGLKAADGTRLTADRPNVLSNPSLAGEPAHARHLTLAVVPNPFTSAATITYSLPKAGNVRLKLYDVTGALVTTLVQGYHTAGSSSFIVHRSSLACGIYLLSLETEDGKTAGKLIIE